VRITVAPPKLTDTLVLETIAILRTHGDVAAASAAIGIPQSALQARVKTARKRFPDALAPATGRAGWALNVEPYRPRIRRQAGSSETADSGVVPLSEDQLKFHASWGPGDCIAELRRIAELDTTKVVSRNYFRNASAISEATWNRYFGTFEEFKRQAEIILSRHAHRMERDIAKHASVDKMRAMNADKADWEGAYLRPSSRRWQTALVASDLHDLHCDPFYRRVLIDTALRVQPEKIILNGDIFDLPEFSKHFQDPRSFLLVDRIRWVHAFLRELRETAPEAEIIFVEGNHEYRLLRHLTEQTPAMMTVLADLHGYTVPKLLGLEEFEVNFVARADLTAFTQADIKNQIRKNYVKLWGDAQLYGHFPQMRGMGIPGASGHHHTHVVWADYSPIYGPWEWHQLGCGHRREAEYCAGERWSNGFLLAHCDTLSKRSQFEYVDLSHHGAMVGGLFYERASHEPVLDQVVFG